MREKFYCPYCGHLIMNKTEPLWTQLGYRQRAVYFLICPNDKCMKTFDLSDSEDWQ